MIAPLGDKALPELDAALFRVLDQLTSEGAVAASDLQALRRACVHGRGCLSGRRGQAAGERRLSHVPWIFSGAGLRTDDGRLPLEPAQERFTPTKTPPRSRRDPADRHQ